MDKRKVQLWRFVDQDDDPLPEVPRGALHKLLLRAADAGNDLTHSDRYGFRTQLEAVPGPRPHFVLHRLRNTDLPSERRNGRIVALDSQVQELAEGSHVLLLPDNLFAFVGSGISPRPGRLAEWIRARVGWDLWVQPVLRRDLGAVLSNVTKVSNVELAIPASEVARLDLSGFFEGEDDPLSVLRFSQQFQHGGIIRMGWSVGHGKQHDQGFFRNLVERIRRADVKGFNVAKAKVYVEDGDAVPVDFIHDKVVVEVEVDETDTRQRTLPNRTAYKAMTEAWEHFQREENVLITSDEPESPPLVVPDALIDPDAH